jgi:hypothetical protein
MNSSRSGIDPFLNFTDIGDIDFDYLNPIALSPHLTMKNDPLFINNPQRQRRPLLNPDDIKRETKDIEQKIELLKNDPLYPNKNIHSGSNRSMSSKYNNNTDDTSGFLPDIYNVDKFDITSVDPTLAPEEIRFEF